MYNDTITLFNRYESKLGDTWYPSILHNANLNMDKASIIAKYGSDSQDNAVLNVQYALKDGQKMVGSKLWLPPKEWRKQTNDKLSQALTFSSKANAFDFFIVGEWDSEEPIADDDYIDGFYEEMKLKYDYVFAITDSAFYDIIPHFEVMAK